MTTRIYVKPTDPKYVGMPHAPSRGRPLPEAGDLWPDDAFTHKRIAEGAIIIAERPTRPTEETVAAQPAQIAPRAVVAATPPALAAPAPAPAHEPSPAPAPPPPPATVAPPPPPQFKAQPQPQPQPDTGKAGSLGTGRIEPGRAGSP